MYRKAFHKKLKAVAREYRIELAQQVRLLQKVMKMYLAKKRVQEMKVNNF